MSLCLQTHVHKGRCVSKISYSGNGAQPTHPGNSYGVVPWSLTQF